MKQFFCYVTLAYVAFSLFPAAVFAWPSSGCDQEDINLATKLLEREQAEMNVGRGLARDVALAQEYLLDVRFCAGVEGKIEYCKKKLADSKKALIRQESEYSDGILALSAYLSSLRRFMELKSLCSTSAVRVNEKHNEN